MLLNDKKALITGGGSGLGLAIACAFLAEGADVCIVGRREEKLREAARSLEAGISPEAGGASKAARPPAADGTGVVAGAVTGAGNRIVHFAGDVTREEDAAAVLEFACAKLGGIDILVNNAGIMRFAPIAGCGVEMVEETFRINTFAPIIMIRLAVPVLRSRGGGSIINMTSLSGIRPAKGSSVYSASKAALVMVSQSMAMETAADNIRINLIAPGLIEDTELGNAMFTPEQVKASYERFSSLHPLGRNGKPEDVASCALFLASDASAFITGAVIPVDGGRFLTMNG